MKTEELAYWFLRLNGCCTILNFILHPDRGGAQRTDADVVGVRFPYREELGWTKRPLLDHKVFAESRQVDILIAEVKSARASCQINGPWTNPESGNVGYLLRAMGVFPHKEVDAIARQLNASYAYSGDVYRVRLLAFGAKRNHDLHPSVVQLTWAEDVVPFVYKRFAEHAAQKAQNEQWDDAGRDLFRQATAAGNAHEFSERILRGLT